MDEYIEREALLADIDAAMENEGMGYVVGQTLKRYVKRAPAANVEPVVHGKWICGNGYRSCPICHDGRRTIVMDNYCPNCGSKMDN